MSSTDVKNYLHNAYLMAMIFLTWCFIWLSYKVSPFIGIMISIQYSIYNIYSIISSYFYFKWYLTPQELTHHSTQYDKLDIEMDIDIDDSHNIISKNINDNIRFHHKVYIPWYIFSLLIFFSCVGENVYQFNINDNLVYVVIQLLFLFFYILVTHTYMKNIKTMVEDDIYKRKITNNIIEAFFYIITVIVNIIYLIVTIPGFP